MVNCSAQNCMNSHRKGYVMVRFPRDEALREKWRIALGRQDFSPSQNNRLCEVHFELSQWEKYRCRLRKSAVPLLFCSCNAPSTQEIKLEQPLRFVDHLYSKCEHKRIVIHQSNCALTRAPAAVPVPFRSSTSKPECMESPIKSVQKQNADCSSFHAQDTNNNSQVFCPSSVSIKLPISRLSIPARMCSMRVGNAVNSTLKLEEVGNSEFVSVHAQQRNTSNMNQMLNVECANKSELQPLICEQQISNEKYPALLASVV